MSNIISDSVSKLSAITDHTPIDWDAFDSVLKGLEDINAYDEHYEETILSEFMEMSRNVQSGNTQNLKSSAASNQAAVCACAHSRYFTGGSPSGLRV